MSLRCRRSWECVTVASSTSSSFSSTPSSSGSTRQGERLRELCIEIENKLSKVRLGPYVIFVVGVVVESIDNLLIVMRL